MRADPALSGLTWPDLNGTHRTLVVPIGSVEQHGPHLPLDTDTRIADAVARRAVERLDGARSPVDGARGPVDGARGAAQPVVLAPALPYGASGEHEGFPGTVSIGQQGLRTVLVELSRSATRWADRIVIVNGHGGNAAPLVSAVRLLRSEGREVAWFPCAFPEADAHAGATETSVLLSLAPDRVRTDRFAAGNTEPISDLMGPLRERGVVAVAPTGVLGDPTRATAARGGALLGDLVNTLATALTRWRIDEQGRLR
jgi:mycofactocin system creatininase family protein